MRDPLVCAIMLTKDRSEMAARAVRAFRAQTYPNKTLLIYNTGESDEIECGCGPEGYHVMAMPLGRTIGALRNAAIGFRSEYHPQGAEIIIHFDDDDYSHPNRIAEQVAHLQSSGADAVGYNELLFWREPRTIINPSWMSAEALQSGAAGEYVCGQAWPYKNQSIFPPPGTSLCYWRKTWERKPFGDFPKGRGGTGEDYQWCKGLNVASLSSICDPEGPCRHEPRMIASIHGSNTMPYDIEGDIARGAHTNWKRVHEWDEYCRDAMEL